MTSLRSALASATFALSSLVFVIPAAQAQGASGSAQGEADIELGATQASEIEMGAGRSRARAGGRADGPGGDVRLAVQGRLDAINTLAMSDPGIPGGGPGIDGRRLLVPIITPGVRLLDDGALFLGAGLGFSGRSVDEGGGDEASRSGWSFSPMVGYDVLSDDSAALALLGWLNFASLGETEVCMNGNCADANDDAFGWGLSLGAQLRGYLTQAVALGGEFGWGFLDISADPTDDWFVHGVFGNIFLEASLAL